MLTIAKIPLIRKKIKEQLLPLIKVSHRLIILLKNIVPQWVL